MMAKLKFQGKEIEIPDVEKVSGMRKFTGLIFNKRGNALLFDFNSAGKPAIHSLFCPDFLAIWLNQGKIVDYKLVTSGKFKIQPEKEFTRLLEIPLNNKYNEVVSFFLKREKV